MVQISNRKEKGCSTHIYTSKIYEETKYIEILGIYHDFSNGIVILSHFQIHSSSNQSISRCNSPCNMNNNLQLFNYLFEASN